MLAHTQRPTRCSSRTCRPAVHAAEDIVAELEPSVLITACPYKGKAGYHNVRLSGGEIVEDLVCATRTDRRCVTDRPLHCFYDERVDVDIDASARPGQRRFWSTKAAGEQPAARADARLKARPAAILGASNPSFRRV